MNSCWIPLPSDRQGRTLLLETVGAEKHSNCRASPVPADDGRVFRMKLIDPGQEDAAMVNSHSVRLRFTAHCQSPRASPTELMLLKMLMRLPHPLVVDSRKGPLSPYIPPPLGCELISSESRSYLSLREANPLGNNLWERDLSCSRWSKWIAC